MDPSPLEDLHRACVGSARSTYVIAVLITLGVIGAAGGWLYHRQAQRRAIALWQGEAAELIVHAPHIEVLQLEAETSPQDAQFETVVQAGQCWKIIARADATQAPGMAHLRHRLVHDTSFDWSKLPDVQSATWQYALRFSDQDKRASLLFDLDRQCVGLAETGAVASIAPIAPGLADWLPGLLAESGGQRVRRTGAIATEAGPSLDSAPAAAGR